MTGEDPRGGPASPASPADHFSASPVPPEPGQTDQTLEAPAPALHADAPPGVPDARPARPAHREAEQVGPYRILEKLGEGGMGAVYKAEQKHPVRRLVALKVIKLGMDSKEVVARFEAERQALALMSHPNVAKVYEAGTTDTGRLYFAMEHVAGIALTRYCDESRLTTKQRLELFIQVCHAVQHAHQKGIIHRDLKPSNVLVTHFDGKPVPKVIDFGIAKAANQALTEHTLYTRTGTLIGTPEYMSPEQALTSGLDVDTRSDIYSLGVILYELLTGTLPLDPKSLHQASLEQMAHLIRNVEPPKPSTRIGALPTNAPSAAGRGGSGPGAGGAGSAGPAGPTLSDVASLRRCDARSLQRELRGDLDWITLKAMEKDRTRRYETANGLAMDLRRHLEHEPVLARPPSAVYRLRKFVRKYRMGVAAAALVALALLLGVVGTTAGLVRARSAEGRARAAEKDAISQRNAAAGLLQDVSRARVAAQQQAERATAVSGFLQSVLASAQPDVLGGGHEARVVDLLRSAETTITKELADQPEAEIQTRFTLFRTYQSLGLFDEASANLNRAHELVKRTGMEETETGLRVAIHAVRWRLSRGVPPDQCEPIARSAVETARRVFGEQHEVAVQARGALAYVLAWAGKSADAEAIYQSLVGPLRRLGPSRVAGPETAVLLIDYAEVLLRRGESSRAESLYREALEFLRACKHRNLTLELLASQGLVNALRRQDKWTEIAELCSRILSELRPRLGDAGPGMQATMSDYASALRRLGQDGEAAGVQRQLMAALAAVADAPAVTPAALTQRAQIRARVGRFKEALADCMRATELNPSQESAWFYGACLLAYLGEERQYQEHCRRELDLFGSPRPGRADKRAAKACLLLPGGGDVGRAEAIIDRALPSDAGVFLAWDQLTKGMAEYRAGRFEECIRWTGEAAGTLPIRAGTASAELYAAMAHHRLGRREQARRMLDGVTRWVEQELPAAGVDDLGVQTSVENWLILHVALREATALIGGPTPDAERVPRAAP